MEGIKSSSGSRWPRTRIFCWFHRSSTTILLSSTKAHRVQGFTKVFKVRPGAQATPHSEKTTTQQIRFSVEAGGSLFLLPDPVTCFRDASYRQIQTFDVEQGGSAVVLDWITSGRMATGEEWVMKRYYSLNEVRYEGKRIAKDVLLLEDEDKANSLLAKLTPYHCYAMVILCGPQTTSVITSLTAKYSQISVFKQRSPPPLIWSITQIDGGGAVVRAAGVRTEMVKHWLRDALSDLSSVIGNDVYKRTFA